MTEFAKPVLMHPNCSGGCVLPDGKPDAPLPQPMTAILREAYSKHNTVAECQRIVAGYHGKGESQRI